MQVAIPWQCSWATPRICGTGFGRRMARRPAYRRMRTPWTATLSVVCRLLQIPLGRSACTPSVPTMIISRSFPCEDVLAASLSGLMHYQELPQLGRRYVLHSALNSSLTGPQFVQGFFADHTVTRVIDPPVLIGDDCQIQKLRCCCAGGHRRSSGGTRQKAWPSTALALSSSRWPPWPVSSTGMGPLGCPCTPSTGHGLPCAPSSYLTALTTQVKAAALQRLAYKQETAPEMQVQVQSYVPLIHERLFRGSIF